MTYQLLNGRLPRRIARLNELAHNLWWNWHPKARDLFRAVDYPLWRESGHNPVRELYEVSPARLETLIEDKAFLTLYDSVISDFESEMQSRETWFSKTYPRFLSGPIAYFSMEFAIHNSLPIYAGGLGILAGDLCKEASDLGMPLVGIGFMYPQGYFHQHISADGWQEEIYGQLDFEEAPINRVLAKDGQKALARVWLGYRFVSIAAWEVKVGRVSIYLLDTNLEENAAQDRELSARLYTADPEMRIQQEIILGIGGVRVLRSLGIRPSIWHANEGHTTFMMLERIREEVEAGVPFNEALKNVRAITVFTTHTPVASGHDCFMVGVMDKYFHGYWESLGVDREIILELGRMNGQAGFNMTALGLKTADQRNAVSRLHSIVTKRMWAILWPAVEEEKVPISYVTNGVHLPTWVPAEVGLLFEKYLGNDWCKRQADPSLWEHVKDIPDEELWSVHQQLKRRLLNIMLERAQKRWAEGGINAQQVVTMGSLLNPGALTIGYSRRFTEYKRPSLILSDIGRLKKIINNPLRPVQIIFAGKSHPADFSGKYLLQRVYKLASDREFQGRIAFIEDYDMHVARYMTHGIDVWLNNPRRLQEACGTSGMKASINGIPQLSVRDGWWAEGYNGANGWAIGGGPEAAFSENQDQVDAESLYRLLEEEIVPQYYEQDINGVSHGWVQVMKEAIRTAGLNFSACRMMMDYIQRTYQAIPQNMRSRI